MECPVCYSGKAFNTFTCGHHLCTSCTERWYLHHDEPTCPMCRKDICFRGVTRVKKKMELERRHQVYVDIMNELMTECTEECEPFLLSCLALIQERYSFVCMKYPDTTPYGMELVLRFSWVPFKKEYWSHDIPTFVHHLFIHKTEYGNLSEHIHHSTQMNSNATFPTLDQRLLCPTARSESLRTP